MSAAPAIDLDLLDLEAHRAAVASRRALAWLAGLLVLVAVAIVLLAAYLGDVESQEEERQRRADAEWLEQTLRFHFRRLEADLAGLRPGDAAPARAGALWRGGAIAFRAWLPAGDQPGTASWPEAMRAAPAELALMLDTARGLRRAAYAGPLAGPGKRRLLWLALPRFDGEHHVGSQLAAVDIERALERAVPGWFLADHALQVLPDASAAAARLPIGLPGAQLELQLTVLSPNPALAPRAFFVVALLFLSGMLTALLFLVRDVERRRRVESRLRTQIALRQALERSVTLGLRAWDLDGRLLYVNQAFCRLSGWSADELLAGSAPYWPEAQGDELQRVERAALDSQQLGEEVGMLHRDGRRLDLLLHAAPLALADGTAIGWMASVLDLTERRRIEQLAARQQERLEASARLVAVGEVASTLAHELNQPLGALSGFAAGLHNRLDAGRITPQETLAVVDRIARLADKAGRVIQRVNAFARRQEPARQPVELAAFVARVVAQVPRPDAVALDCLPAPPLTLPADALLLEHALHNLVLNAVEWADRAGRPPAVRVGLLREDGRAGVRVEDSGPGIPDDQLASLFDAFISRKPGGMGMGLSICRSIVEAHRGRVEVGRSEALGGAQFTLWLPLN